MMAYLRSTVAVTGGELALGCWGEEGPLVVAVHGITSSHLAWTLVAEQLASDHRFVAVDLRGRGDSRDLPPPYGIDRHADDIAEVIRAYGESAVLVGHSMGAFVAVATARRHPDLVRRLVLVDGGAPLPLPPGVPVDATEADLKAAIELTVGTAFARLTQTFADRAAVDALWRSHPALTDWNPAMTAYADYDVVETDGGLVTKCRLEAAVRDAQDIYATSSARSAALPVPGVFLRAERGMLGGPTPLYPHGYASRWLPGIEEYAVAGANHYTITLSPSPAVTVADAVRDDRRVVA
ncbi:MAG: alpha/beta hydrolase [Hamadaea sp.]|uniref:alpha/beta fold hydrolase n=1 Tax=Hamadaea sp. TaxID=2024425 RepID=UPI0017B335FF|nr:alpha/beta hydrolase [Hamadaea sp.]NUR70137.1 alpha/beta hydrolase [Hamadaea sp.]NUT23625.1 alpha/beta hydrolase [Hamadaea sp.]